MEIEKNVFVYWEGKNFKLINELISIMRFKSNNNKNFSLYELNEKNIKNFIDLPNCFDDLIIPHKADYVRINIIEKMGGLWVDADTLMMSNLNDLFDLINNENKKGFFVLEEENYLCNGVFFSNKNTDIMKEWVYIANQIIHPKMSWTAIGNDILNYFYKNNILNIKEDYLIINGKDSIYPIHWKDCKNIFLFNNNKNLIERNFQPLIILVNSVYKEFELMNESEINNANITYFLNKSKQT